MNENINLVEILKEHEGEIFYSPLFGDVRLLSCCFNDPYPIRIETLDETRGTLLTKSGLYEILNNGECMLLPSKDQRDWNKWVKEQKSKVPKTWNDLERIDKIIECGAEIVRTFNNRWWDSTKGNTPIEESALALLKIHQLIDNCYGGNITNEEWENASINKYCISTRLDDTKFFIETFYTSKKLIAFHTREQASEFLSYPENVELLKTYFMI